MKSLTSLPQFNEILPDKELEQEYQTWQVIKTELANISKRDGNNTLVSQLLKNVQPIIDIGNILISLSNQGAKSLDLPSHRQVFNYLFSIYFEHSSAKTPPEQLKKEIASFLEGFSLSEVQNRLCKVISNDLSEASVIPPSAAIEFLLQKKLLNSPEVVESLVNGLKSHIASPTSMLGALQQIHSSNPELFSNTFLPFREAISGDTRNKIASLPYWQAIIRAIYLAPWSEEIKPENIIRDSLLTPQLLDFLKNDTDETILKEFFLEKLNDQSIPAVQRDAAWALIELGEVFLVKTALRAPTLSNVFRSVESLYTPISFFLASRHKFLDFLTQAKYDSAEFHIPMYLGLFLRLPNEIDTTFILSSEISHDEVLHQIKISQEINDVLLYAMADLDHEDNRLAAISEYWKLSNQFMDFLSSCEESLRQKYQNTISRYQLLYSVWKKLFFDKNLNQKIYEVKTVNVSNLVETFSSSLNEFIEQRNNLNDWGAFIGNLPYSTLGSSTLTLSNTQNLGKFLSLKTLKISNSLKALRLAKEGEFTQKSVLLLEELLNGQNDLLRYETQQVLSGIEGNLSKSSIESLAENSEYQSHRTEIVWALYRVKITQPEWIDDWVAQKKISVLESIHNIDSECVSTWARHIINSDQDVKRAILHSTRWIINTPHSPSVSSNFFSTPASASISPITWALVECIQSVSDEELLDTAFYALGFSEQNQHELIEEIISVTRNKTLTKKTMDQVYSTLARLTDGVQEATVDKITNILREKTDSLSAASALVYIKIKRSEDVQQAEKELKNTLPDNPQLIKAAVLAGSDDAVWAEYHEDIVNLVVSLLKQGDENSIRVAVESLQESINQPWPQNRIALAVISKGLEELGDAINTTIPLTELEKLLLSGTKEQGSFNSRRFSIRSLSSLRIVSSEALKALFKSCADVEIVLKQSIEAAGRFRRLAKDFSEDQAILNLIEAFEQESVVAAYIAVKLLAELGSSPAVLEIPNLRKKIAIELSKVITKPIAQQDVYLPFENDLEKTSGKISGFNSNADSIFLNRPSGSVYSYGKLATHILSGLVKVVGLPEK